MGDLEASASGEALRREDLQQASKPNLALRFRDVAQPGGLPGRRRCQAWMALSGKLTPRLAD